MMINKANRETFLDSVCAIMIIYMIYGHICLWCGIKQFEIFQRILFFFMPWFFFKSGMFFRKESLKKNILKGFNRLVVPYMLFSIIGQIVFWIMWLIDGTNLGYNYIMSPLRTLFHEGAVVGNSPLWFLLTLFFVRIIFSVIFNQKINIYLCILLSIIGSFIFCYIDFHNIMYIPNTFCGLFFYMVGYLMRDKQYNKIVLILGFLFYIVYVFIYPSYFDFRSNSVAPSYYILCILSCLGGIIVFNNIFKKLPECKFLSYIGKNSMSYYVLHWIVLGIASIIFKSIMNISANYVLFWLYIFANLLFLPILDIFISRENKKLLGK